MRLSTGCAVEVDGTLVASQGSGQAVEMAASAVRVVGWVDDPDTYPISPKRHSFEYLREVAHLRVRTNTFGAVARVRHTLAVAIHGSSTSGTSSTSTRRSSPPPTARGPARCSASARWTSQPAPDRDGRVDFDQDFFGKEARLTVSGQLDVETYCCALTRVYTFGPTFRAENSNTTRHLSEFWMIEPEMAFSDLTDNADLAEEFLKHLFDDLLTRRAEDMAFFNQRIDKSVVAR